MANNTTPHSFESRLPAGLTREIIDRRYGVIYRATDNFHRAVPEARPGLPVQLSQRAIEAAPAAAPVTTVKSAVTPETAGEVINMAAHREMSEATAEEQRLAAIREELEDIRAIEARSEQAA